MPLMPVTRQIVHALQRTVRGALEAVTASCTPRVKARPRPGGQEGNPFSLRTPRAGNAQFLPFSFSYFFCLWNEPVFPSDSHGPVSRCALAHLKTPGRPMARAYLYLFVTMCLYLLSVGSSFQCHLPPCRLAVDNCPMFIMHHFSLICSKVEACV
jgi:hypothetical protein